jgi:hypothetical protein
MMVDIVFRKIGTDIDRLCEQRTRETCSWRRNERIWVSRETFADEGTGDWISLAEGTEVGCVF